MQVRLADVHVAGRLQPDDRLGGTLRHMVGEEDRTVGGAQTRRVEKVLTARRMPSPTRSGRARKMLMPRL